MAYWGKREYEINPRERMYRGNLYGAAHLITSLANGASFNFFFKANGFAARSLEVASYEILADQSPVFLYLYEGATVSSDGTAMNVRNRDRNSPDASADFNPYHTPTISDDGTLIGIDKLAGNRKGGGLGGNVKFWLPRPNTNYIARVTNNSGQTQSILFSMAWHEGS